MLHFPQANATSFVRQFMANERMNVITHPGLSEVLNTIYKLAIEPDRTQMRSADYTAGLINVQADWRFKLGCINDFAGEFFADSFVPESVACALIGGIDMIVIRQARAWQSRGAREAAAIWDVIGTFTESNPSAFQTARPEERLVYMLATYCDFCEAYALLTQIPDPRRILHQLADLDGPHHAEIMGFPAGKLRDSIETAAKRTYELLIPLRASSAFPQKVIG